MKIVYYTTAAVLLATGCASTPSNLSNAAYRLDRSADALYDQVRDETSNDSLERDAEEFSAAAQDFHRDVRDRKPTDDLRDRFDVVAGRYHELRDEFSAGWPNTRERTVFNDVTRAYLDLERELQYGGDRDRYRYRRDRNL